MRNDQCLGAHRAEVQRAHESTAGLELKRFRRRVGLNSHDEAKLFARRQGWGHRVHRVKWTRVWCAFFLYQESK